MLNPTQTNSQISITGVVDMLWSVVDVAAKDYLSRNIARRADAVHYFQSSQFQRHIKVLGLPERWLPEGVFVEEMPALTIIPFFSRTKNIRA